MALSKAKSKEKAEEATAEATDTEDAEKTQWWVKTAPKMLNAMTNPDSGVRIGVNQVPLGADLPKEGSWLDCQIKAGLIIILKGPVL